jgi:hypothetical protein
MDESKAFLDRPDRRSLAYVFRQNGRIVSVALIEAVGVNSDDRREVLGMDFGSSEAESFWPRTTPMPPKLKKVVDQISGTRSTLSWTRRDRTCSPI